MNAQQFRKKPVVIEAMQYINWATSGWAVAEWSMDVETSDINFSFVAVDDRGDDPDITAEVWDKLHGTWVGVKNGQWIIRGVKGEYYPCDPEVFSSTYELVTE